MKMEKNKHQLISLQITDFLNETASSSPAPGGGSVSALAASLGSALTSMVCRLTIGKKKYADVQEEMEKVLIKSEELRAKFTAIIDEDTEAFSNVMAAFGLPKETDEQKGKRSEAIQEATKSATLVPLKLLALCAEAIALANIAAESGNQNSLSDAGVAALMIQAGSKGAELNIRINLESIQDQAFIVQIKKEMQVHTEKLNSIEKIIIARLKTKL